MAQPIAPDYGQQFLLPPALEDWVPADHPARFIREFVDQLDLATLGFALPTAAAGRPPYAPSLLLKIWLYGYFHRIRATRKLEVACREHLLYFDFHLPCAADRRTGRWVCPPPCRGEDGGAGVLVALWNRSGAFVGEPEPPGPWCPHSNRCSSRPVSRPAALV